MTTTTTALPATIPARIAAWIDALNAAARPDRDATNANHRAQYGRDLYAADDTHSLNTYTLDKPGAKYTRVVMTTYGSRSVHAFIENGTGHVLKSAGWKAPAAGVRYDLAQDADFVRILERLDQFGGYLYKR